MSGSAQDRAQAGGEVKARLAVDVYLVDPVEPILDRVLDRDDVLLDLIHVLKGGVEGCRLTRARRAGDQHGAVGLLERALKALASAAVHAQLIQRVLGVLGVEDSDRRTLAALRRQCRDAQVHPAVLDRDADPAVLRYSFLGDV